MKILCLIEVDENRPLGERYEVDEVIALINECVDRAADSGHPAWDNTGLAINIERLST